MMQKEYVGLRASDASSRLSSASTVRVSYVRDGAVFKTETGLGGVPARTVEAGRVAAALPGAGTVSYAAFSTGVAPELVGQPLSVDSATYMPLLRLVPGTASFSYSTTALFYATGALSTALYAFSWVAVGPQPAAS